MNRFEIRRPGHTRLAAEVLSAVRLGWVVAHFAEAIVHRPRPYEAELVRRLIPPNRILHAIGDMRSYPP